MDMKNTTTSQSLTTNQIVKVLCGHLGSLLEWNNLDAVCGTIDWIADNSDQLKQSFAFIKNQFISSTQADQFKKDLEDYLQREQ